MSWPVVSGAAGMLDPAACSTSVGNAAQRRPHRKAATLRSTATPLSSMARSMRAGSTAIAPCCTATPSSITFAVVVSPNRPIASAAVSRKRLSAVRDTSPSLPGERRELGYAVVGCETIAPVGVGATDADHDGAVGVGADAVGVTRRDEQVEGEQAVDTGAVGVVRRRHIGPAQPEVAHDRAGLLRQTGLVEPPDGPSVEHRRRAEDLADRDHTGPADAGEANGEVVGRHDRLRVGQPRRRIGGGGQGGRPAPAVRPSPSSRWRTPGSHPGGTTGPSCSSSGGYGSCARTACRSAARTGSCSCRRSRRTPRTPAR